MSIPKVSVIIPIYNVEPYIERCARSLFEQTLDNIEYLFINDCTPDHSMEVLQQVLLEYPNRMTQVRIINQPHNMGCAKAREIGIKSSTGEYIIHCDSDDWVDKEMYRVMYEKAINESLDCVICKSLYITDGSNHKKIIDNINDEKMTFINDILYFRTSVSLSSRLVKNNLVNSSRIIFPISHMMEDRCYAVQIAYYANSYGCVEDPYYYYYQNSNSVCAKQDDKSAVRNFQSATANMKLIQSFLRREGILEKYKKALEHSEFVVMGFLVPSLKKNNKYRALWLHTFPKVVRSLWFSNHISFSLKLICFLILVGLYPMVGKLQKIRR